MIGLFAKYRNLLLLGLLVVMLVVSSQMNRDRLLRETAAVSLPVTYTGASANVQTAQTPMEQYRQQRDETAMQDMAALQALADAEVLDAQTREDAAARLQLLVTQREQQTALEGALLETSLWPCVAVISPGSVTVVTEKEALTEAERITLLTMVQAHTDVDAGGVRIVCGEVGEK